jgi:hypothetical protein
MQMRGPLPREKRLLIVFLLLAFVVVFTPSIFRNTEVDHLTAIRAHISQIQSRWLDFQRQNAGFEDIRFFDYAGGDGMFAACGQVSSGQDLAKLRQFMQNTEPPRPIYLDAVEVMDSNGEHAAAGNPSNRSQRHRTLSPISSRR